MDEPGNPPARHPNPEDRRRLVVARGMGAGALALTATIALAGCAALPSQSLDRLSVQEHIATYLAGRYGVPVRSVDCPGALPAKNGSQFRCSTVLAGAPVGLTGTVTRTPGHFAITLNRAVLNTHSTSSLLARQLAAPGRPAARVNCGASPVMVLAPGGTFRCAAKVGRWSTTVTGTASDTQGDVTFSVLMPSPPGTPTRGPRPKAAWPGVVATPSGTAASTATTTTIPAGSSSHPTTTIARSASSTTTVDATATPLLAAGAQHKG